MERGSGESRFDAGVRVRAEVLGADHVAQAQERAAAPGALGGGTVTVPICAEEKEPGHANA